MLDLTQVLIFVAVAGGLTTTGTLVVTLYALERSIRRPLEPAPCRMRRGAATRSSFFSEGRLGNPQAG